MSKRKRPPEPNVLKRPLAEADLDEIWFSIAQDNPAAADRFLDNIEERCRTLAQFPHMGRDREELHPGWRSLPIGKHLIFDIATDEGIEIVRVLSGARDIDAGFLMEAP